MSNGWPSIARPPARPFPIYENAPVIRRLIQLQQMRRNARAYAIAFKRRASFEMPSVLAHHQEPKPLHYPHEYGVRGDFIGVFISDTYGLRKIKGQVRSVIDIGANAGFVSVAAKVNFTGAQAHAYEPNPHLMQYLGRNAEGFGFIAYPQAVGGHDGYVNLDFRGDSNQTRTVRAEQGVRMVSLDEAVDRIGGSVDLMKIDCEGAEWEMLSESKAWSGVLRVAMEYHLFDGQTHDAIGRAIRGAGLGVVKQEFDPKQDYGMVWAINPKRVSSWAG